MFRFFALFFLSSAVLAQSCPGGVTPATVYLDKFQNPTRNLFQGLIGSSGLTAVTSNGKLSLSNPSGTNLYYSRLIAFGARTCFDASTYLSMSFEVQAVNAAVTSASPAQMVAALTYSSTDGCAVKSGTLYFKVLLTSSAVRTVTIDLTKISEPIRKRLSSVMFGNLKISAGGAFQVSNLRFSRCPPPPGTVSITFYYDCGYSGKTMVVSMAPTETVRLLDDDFREAIGAGQLSGVKFEGNDAKDVKVELFTGYTQNGEKLVLDSDTSCLVENPLFDEALTWNDMTNSVRIVRT